MIDRRTFLAGLGATAAVAAAPVAFAAEAVPTSLRRVVPISVGIEDEPMAPYDDLNTITGSWKPQKVLFNVLYDGEFCGFRASPGDRFVMDCPSGTVSRA